MNTPEQNPSKESDPSAALPSPASLPETDDEIEVMRRSMQPDSQANVPSHYADDPRNYEPPASAEAGDWAELATKISRAVKNAGEHQEHPDDTANGLMETFREFLRHAPQSQSKAEAVGAELAAVLAPFVALEIDSFGAVPDAEAYLWKPNHNRRELPGINIAHIKAVKAYAAKFATQNPPENAKGELRASLEEIGRIAGLCLHQNNGRWNPDKEHEQRARHVLEAIAKLSAIRPQPTPSTREEGRT